MTRDSGRHAERGDVQQAPSEGCQSGATEIAHRPTSVTSIPQELIELEVERLVAEAYTHGWRDSYETLVTDFPNILPPHKDAMHEGLAQFKADNRIALTTNQKRLAELEEALREARRAERGSRPHPTPGASS